MQTSPDTYKRLNAVLLVVLLLVPAATFWQMRQAASFRPETLSHPSATPGPRQPAWPDGSNQLSVENLHTLFQAEDLAPATDTEALADFRLAGTFFSYSPAVEGARHAIIDNTRKQTQTIVAEGDMLDAYKIVAIERERVILEQHGERRFLSLSSTRPAPETTAAQPVASQPSAAQDQTMEIAGPFGTQIGENRWVLEQDALMDYYHELLDDPERIAHIYISMKPDYSPDERILGYELDMVGEQQFFEAVGLRQGDIIRKVNSMDMISQQRGEYFLREFVHERLSAVVLDIERDNEDQKLIYLFR